MTYLKRLSLFALALLLVLDVFFACHNGDTTDGETTAGATTVAGTEAPEGSATVYELSSKTTSAKIELRDGQPYIVSLKTESGLEKAGEPIPFNLPTLGRNVLWTHTATDEYDDGEGAVGYVFRFKNDDKQVTYDLYAVAHACAYLQDSARYDLRSLVICEYGALDDIVVRCILCRNSLCGVKFCHNARVTS